MSDLGLGSEASGKRSRSPMRRASPCRCMALATPWWQLGRKEAHKLQVWESFEFRAMDVAKPLLFVSKLVEHGWTVTFGPQGSFLQRGSKKVPVTMTGGVFRIAMDFHGQPAQKG